MCYRKSKSKYIYMTFLYVFSVRLTKFSENLKSETSKCSRVKTANCSWSIEETIIQILAWKNIFKATLCRNVCDLPPRSLTVCQMWCRSWLQTKLITLKTYATLWSFLSIKLHCAESDGGGRGGWDRDTIHPVTRHCTIKEILKLFL